MAHASAWAKPVGTSDYVDFLSTVWDQKEFLMSASSPSQSDLYSRVTQKIVTDLEKGQLMWRQPWNSDRLTSQVMRPLRFNDVPYTGINTLLLWNTMAEKGYHYPHWMTFKQANDLKASVRKGEKGTPIVYADTFTKAQEDNEGEVSARRIPFLKTYPVFNASQIDGLPENYYRIPKPTVTDAPERLETVEQFFARTKADIQTGTKASYNQGLDRVQMPPVESFESINDYYAVLAHEICHWTKHPVRLNRDLGRKHYGDEGYAKEELVAELGACFLAADLGFEPVPEEKHAAYIQSWLSVLQGDKRFIFKAASHAQKAADYLHKLQSSPSTI